MYSPPGTGSIPVPAGRPGECHFHSALATVCLALGIGRAYLTKSRQPRTSLLCALPAAHGPVAHGLDCLIRFPCLHRCPLRRDPSGLNLHGMASSPMHPKGYHNHPYGPGTHMGGRSHGHSRDTGVVAGLVPKDQLPLSGSRAEPRPRLRRGGAAKPPDQAPALNHHSTTSTRQHPNPTERHWTWTRSTPDRVHAGQGLFSQVVAGVGFEPT